MVPPKAVSPYVLLESSLCSIIWIDIEIAETMFCGIISNGISSGYQQAVTSLCMISAE